MKFVGLQKSISTHVVRYATSHRRSLATAAWMGTGSRASSLPLRTALWPTTRRSCMTPPIRCALRQHQGSLYTTEVCNLVDSYSTNPQGDKTMLHVLCRELAPRA